MKTTQHQRIIAYLKENGKISSFIACVKLGVSNLPLRVKELRAKGYTITAEKVKHVNRYGKTIYYNDYFLNDKGVNNENN